MTFELLNVQPEIIKALKEEKIHSPTQIQKLSIPIIKAGKDLIGISNTGSGKTVAFGVPVLEKVKPKAGLQVLIITPTRELAVQIRDELKKFSKYMQCRIANVYGGVALGPQIDRIAKSEIVVGTTGRLVDHLNRGNLDLSQLKCVVLDEADKMVEMGFIEDIRLLLKHVPKTKQLLLFGATISNEINDLKNKHMNNPVTTKAEMHVSEDLLEQYYYDIQPYEKFSLLVHLLKKEETERVLIFCSTRAGVETLTRNLKANSIKAEMMHGKLGQSSRLRIIENFNKGHPKILVASAVAARGLNIKKITHVFNYSLSDDAEEYIHRVGRTARAGESGIAITLLEPRDHDAFSQILRQYKFNVKKMPKEDFPKLRFQQGSFHNKSSFGSRGRFSNQSHGRSYGNGSEHSSRPESGRSSFHGRTDGQNRYRRNSNASTSRFSASTSRFNK